MHVGFQRFGAISIFSLLLTLPLVPSSAGDPLARLQLNTGIFVVQGKPVDRDAFYDSVNQGSIRSVLHHLPLVAFSALIVSCLCSLRERERVGCVMLSDAT